MLTFTNSLLLMLHTLNCCYRNPKTLPLIAAGPMSYATAHWANGLMFKAYKTGLGVDDLFDTPWKDSAGYNSARYTHLTGALYHLLALVTAGVCCKLYSI